MEAEGKPEEIKLKDQDKFRAKFLKITPVAEEEEESDEDFDDEEEDETEEDSEAYYEKSKLVMSIDVVACVKLSKKTISTCNNFTKGIIPI